MTSMTGTPALSQGHLPISPLQSFSSFFHLPDLSPDSSPDSSLGIVPTSIPIFPSSPNSIRYNSAMSVPLTKVDSAIAGLSISDEKPAAVEKEVKGKKTHKRTSSTAEGIWNIKDLGE
jgi:hypothetical protein